MTRDRFTHLALPAAIALLAGTAAARQDAAPKPAEPAKAAQPAKADQPEVKFQPNGRKVLNGEPTKLAFKNVTVEQILPFIVESTGKVIMPQQDILTRKVTVVNDREIPRAKALDLVLVALRESKVAVVETNDTISLRDIGEVIQSNPMVIPADESVLGRTDLGTIASKVFALKQSNADEYDDVLKNTLPDYAKLSIDKDSNRFTITGDIALLQRIERIVGEMDQSAAGATKSQTFSLTFADCEQIATQIENLFSASSSRAGAGRNRNQQNQQNQFNPFRQQGQQQDGAAQSAQLKVSANTQQNSVTVVAEPAVLEQIEHLIKTEWDKEIDIEHARPKIYDLQYIDPVKLRAVLEASFGKPSTTTGGGGGGGGGGGQGGGGNQGSSQPVGTSPSNGLGRLAGQFSFQAMPEAQKLLVIARSPDYFHIVDDIVKKLDVPSTIGLPDIIELKHASSEDLAEQLNTLLAQDGTLATIRRSASGLSEGTSTSSPFASTTTTDPNTGAQQTNTTNADNIVFWWSRSRPPTDKQLASNLVGQIRIVPVWRQNALMVLAPIEYRASVVKLIQDLDRPGRQVLLSAIVAEVTLDDATSLGLRWSSQNITPTRGDNSISIGNTASGTENNIFGSLFDTSVLNTNVNLNLVLQALAQKTAVTVLSEPKIFTSDNQEAEFFSGQDIPFITESQPNNNGQLLQSFDYKAVGIQLRVRPRITVKRDVDLSVNLQLSSVVQGQTLFGGAIIDRRETTTQLIVANGQTVVISGILRSEDSDIVRKVPILGDIPILKWLFSSKERTKTNSELLVFITPLVVDNPEESAAINQPYLQRLQEREDAVKKGAPESKNKGTEPSLPGSLTPEPAPKPAAAPKPASGS